ncbi:putative callose synthase 8, partial [Carica papaya]|uniref:putative callose synthase 8 n=1 Tax=Carica papaya TaxID=3649 RepID=UPI000B8CA68F
MSGELVPAEPISEASTSYAPPVRRQKGTHNSDQSIPLTRSLTYGDHVVPGPFDSERLPPTLASGIQKFLRVANLIEPEEPRVAYLCRFHAFEIAHSMDHNSTGRGVRQFKTSLLQRLEQDEETTIRTRKESSDTRELKRVYHAYKEYIISHGGAFDLENSHREKLINARRIASVLYEVLKTVTNAAGPQAIADRDSIHAKSEFYVPYNILSLDHGSIQLAIMQLPEIKAAVAVVRNTRGLPSHQDFNRHRPFVDLFEFLQYSFGFQEGNVANQREHLILLLANTHTRQSNKQSSTPKSGDEALDELMKKFFKNYTNWCKFLRRKSNIRLPYVQQEAQQYKILYIGLYLLIWGEAANLRFMPECLCYIFHHMAYELHGMLTGSISMTAGDKVRPAYGGEPEAFLKNVVTPIYRVIYEEAAKSKGGTANHSSWRNYDDLNEYFWSHDCFQIGWPMRLDHYFFQVQYVHNQKVSNARPPVDSAEEKVEGEGKEDDESDSQQPAVSSLSSRIWSILFLSAQPTFKESCQSKWLGKTNFVEIRSFWQIFRSFDRMWHFFILSLQAMIIMACHDVESPLQMFDVIIFEDILSIFITSAILKLIQ